MHLLPLTASCKAVSMYPVYLHVCVLLLIADVVSVDFQETKRYTFPVALSMREFCESNKEISDDQEYELFSVVIHG